MKIILNVKKHFVLIARSICMILRKKECATASEYMFKERAAASESKCATASEYMFKCAAPY